MTPAARIQACIDIIEKINKSTIPMDSTIGDYMRVRRYVGAKDRAEIAERCYAMMRAWGRVGWWLTRTGTADTPRNRVITFLILGEGCDEKRIGQLFNGAKHSPQEITEAEQGFIARLDGSLEHSEMPEAIRVECPSTHEEVLRQVFGADFVPEMVAMLTPATLDLRVNVFLATREKVQVFLKADGVETKETPVSPWGLRCAGKAYLSKTKAFHKGWIEIQDEGSQLIAWLCDAQPGMQVLDYCAGAGGKTLALAASMMRKGRIVAMDTETRRLEKGRERFRKAQVSDIIEVRPLLEERHKKWLRRQKETFDRVLVDVPCSGSGTWRRNPDMRWRQYGPSLEELVAVQADILDRVAHTLKPGGKLIYATCSLFPAENESQVEAFLQRHPNYRPEPLPEAIRNGSYMRLTPLRHGTDGFFAAVMVKV
ncbi:MAG: RsmB/NOP family class I SAM-dependent RNA methyltransferase [Alphaproteobacteria bacterium]|nr:RsmB/NOP family class I SAM-dependent RNA methyltransferase [Alphaproteobacteria bacterium]